MLEVITKILQKNESTLIFEAASSERCGCESRKQHFLLDRVSRQQLGIIKLPQEDPRDLGLQGDQTSQS